MAVENVVCPHCGEQALATIPLGQRLLEIKRSWDSYSGTNTQTCGCIHCEREFYAITKSC